MELEIAKTLTNLENKDLSNTKNATFVKIFKI